MTARQQAELMEKEKAINERQERVNNLRKNIGPLKQKMGAAVQDKRRAELTITELSKFTEERPVYQAMGRMFVKRGVKSIKEVMAKEVESSNAKLDKGKDDLKRLEELIKNEHSTLEREVSEFTSVARAHGLVENNSTTPITQVKK